MKKCVLAFIMVFLCVGSVLPAGAAAKTAAEALQLLQSGNQRFMKNTSAHPRSTVEMQNMKTLASQNGYAYATIFSCSDSRVPVERIFDASIMDLFVVRVAGNVVNSDVTATVEYGLEVVRTPLLVIMGHTHCGAVGEAVHMVVNDEMAHEEEFSEHIIGLLNKIKPAVEEVRARDANMTEMALWESSVKQNVWLALEDLFRQSEIIRRNYHDGNVRIVCAVYDMQTGKVHWLEEQHVKEIYDAVLTQ